MNAAPAAAPAPAPAPVGPIFTMVPMKHSLNSPKHSQGTALGWDRRYAHQRHNHAYNNTARAHNKRLMAHHRAVSLKSKKNYVRPVDVATGFLPRDANGARLPLCDIPASECQF